MPRYMIFAEDSSLSDKTKAEIVREITRIHAEVMKAQRASCASCLFLMRAGAVTRGVDQIGYP
jgi:hypothetical protein